MKTFRSLALSCSVAVLLAGCGTSPEASFTEAGKAFAAHRYSQARAGLVNVLQQQPDNVAALDMAARVNLARPDGIGAIAMLDRLERLGKLPRDAAELYGEAELVEGRFDAALRRVEGANSAEAWRIRAMALIGKGDIDGARNAFATGLTTSGGSGRLLGEYAHFALAHGDMGLARDLAARAMATKPATPEALLAGGEVALAEGTPKKALAIYEQVAKGWPENRAATLGKIAALGTLGRKSDVAALVKRALAASPRDADLLYLSARVAAENRKWTDVRDIFQSNESQFEGNWQAQGLYGEALLELGQVEQARTRLAAAVSGLPRNRHGRVLLGRAQIATGDAAAAVDTLLPLAELPDATQAELALLVKAAQLSGYEDADMLSRRARAAPGSTVPAAARSGMIDPADRSMPGA